MGNYMDLRTDTTPGNRNHHHRRLHDRLRTLPPRESLQLLGHPRSRNILRPLLAHLLRPGRHCCRAGRRNLLRRRFVCRHLLL